VRGPDFAELVGDDLPAGEAARLRSVHEMLVEAGPPPELPPYLAGGVPTRRRKDAQVEFMPRRRLGAALLIAAAVAAVAFGAGYITGHRGASFAAEESIPMHGTNGVTASASLQLASRSPSGNWPIKMVIHGLPDLGKTGYYELFLTRGTRKLASCGTFVVGKRTTVVQLNAPYLVGSDSNPGWVVVAHVRGKPQSPPLMTTSGSA
jgi:hypothetical protein